MTAALKFVDTENIIVDCLHRDPESPCPLLFSNTGTEGGNISLKNSVQKTHNPIKGTFPSPLSFYYTIIHHVLIFKVYQFVLLSLRGNAGLRGWCSSLSPIAFPDFLD